MRYYKNLTLKANAQKNNCSVSRVKAHAKNLNISPSKARSSVFRGKVVGAKTKLEKEGKKATIRSICDLTGLSNKTVIKYCNDSERKDIAKSTPRSYSFTQTEILQNIISLYCNTNDTIQCDLTFSTGKMWKGLKRPEYIFDLKPQLEYVKPLNEVKLYNNYFSSCLFDLPFIIRSSTNDNAIIANRFDAFCSERELYEANTNMLGLAFNILKISGLCVIKTQDTSYANKQIWTHKYIMDEAERIGFVVEDIFICLSKNMLVNNSLSAKHARKQHCYFFVLKKSKKI